MIYGCLDVTHTTTVIDFGLGDVHCKVFRVLGWMKRRNVNELKARSSDGRVGRVLSEAGVC